MLPNVVLFIPGKNRSSKAISIFLMANLTEPNIVLIPHLIIRNNINNRI